jgi:hypothetical protein
MSDNPFKQVDDLAKEIMQKRKRPLFVMYYYEFAGGIIDDDVRDIHDEFRRRGWNRDNPHNNLDVLINSYGGNADASYRVGQIFHDFAKNIVFLVPFHATSGATLVCLGGTEIRLGAYAALSPIDTRIDSIELASIDSFKQFAIDCRRDVEKALKESKSNRTTNVESVLLCELVKQNTALGIGSLYRRSTVTGYYTHRLLYDYMFAGHSNRAVLAGKIADSLLRRFPSHNFVLDYHMALTYLELPVKEMKDAESDKTKSLVNLLDELTRQGIICKDIGVDEHGETLKSPFFRLYT